MEGSFDVLIADDDPVMRQLLAIHLADAGYGVRIAQDALEAGREILRKRPDLLITDISMPFMTGLELVRAVRQDASAAPVPVIVLSSMRDDRSDDEARALGVARFLAKPVTRDVLLAAVARILEPG